MYMSSLPAFLHIRFPHPQANWDAYVKQQSGQHFVNLTLADTALLVNSGR